MLALRSAVAPTSARKEALPEMLAAPPTSNDALPSVTRETESLVTRKESVSRLNELCVLVARSPAKAPSENETPADAEEPKEGPDTSKPAEPDMPIPAPPDTPKAAPPDTPKP